ncbi:MAG: cytochrome c [Pseudomonadota bacterium]|nr:cytochrome c [Pseudomonadota bacterium]
MKKQHAIYGYGLSETAMRGGHEASSRADLPSARSIMVFGVGLLLVMWVLFAVVARAESPLGGHHGMAHGQNAQPADTREPLPLSPQMAAHQLRNMREHLEAIQRITAALAADDFEGIANAVQRIGFSPAMGAMCERMGQGAPGFTEMALNFHRTADTIGEAARQQDRNAVVTALSNTLATCTACHARFRQEIVSPAAGLLSP